MARNRQQNNDVAAESPDLGEAQIKKHKPKDTRLRQQRLPAWQPILTAKTVIPIVFSISILFIPIGIVLLRTSNSVHERVIFYVDETTNKCISGQSDVCHITFELGDNFEGDVYFYYGLENYYQNHRRYIKSRSDKQLLGIDLQDTSDCSPFERIGDVPIAPCGAIANSMFNDTFELWYKTREQVVPWTHKGMVWPVDLESKFRNPPCYNGETCNSTTDLCTAFSKTTKPPNWQRLPCHLDANVENSGFQNADFIIWMRTAALPDFRKPYRKLDRNIMGPFSNGLPSGNYVLVVHNHYNVSSFGGKKSFIITTTSWMGGKNPFLGIAYLVVGTLCACLGVVFIFVHLKYGHRLEELAGLEQTSRRSRIIQ